jgi:hypothetical protein
MKRWGRYAVTIAAGLLLGVGGAVVTVKSQVLGSDARIGAWATGQDFGSERAGPLTRAVIAMKGLLALPASEARYYVTTVDDAGDPLDGRCRYRVTGGDLPTKWWSITLYGADNYLVANPAGIFSFSGTALPPAKRTGWTLTVAPASTPGHWLPTGGVERFDLTLRTYLPDDGGTGNLTAAQLPRVAKLGCGA